MLSGMNASVSIVLETEDNVLTVPVDALVEMDSKVYVYTSYDEETETFGGLTEVTTGKSDGSLVEIVSGLSQGDSYWYSYLDTVNYSTSFGESGNGSGFIGGRGMMM